MRRLPSSWASIIVMVTLAFALPVTAQTNDYSYVRIVRLSLVEGDVQLMRPGEGQWEAALMNMPIRQDYTLATGQGHAEVEFESGATARIAENTTLYFTELALANGGRITRLTLQQGTATFEANLSRNDIFEVHTPHLATAVTDNARYRVDVTAEGSWVSVWKGDVQVGTLNGASSRVGKGRGAFVGAADTSQMQLIRNAEPDAWDRWVDERDSVILSATHAAQRYTNSPYSYGLSDLYYYGGWYNVPGYGYGWQPYGMPIGWSPFWNGRWFSMNGFGWTWVSYEPWGWLPYHFGSWTCLPGRGWFWVPGQFGQWNPAPVHWVQLGGHIGWVPRSPGDRPGGPPANLPQGPVVNTPRGFIGGTPNQRADLRPGDKPTMLDRPPLDDGVPLRPRGTPGMIGARPLAPENTGGAAPARSPTDPRGFAGRPSAPTGPEPGIIYDKNSRRFIDNPRAPLRPQNDTSGEIGRPVTLPVAPPGPATQPTGVDTTRSTPMTPRNARTLGVPDRPRVSDERIPNMYGRGEGQIGGAPQRPSTMGTPRTNVPQPNTPPPQPRWESRPMPSSPPPRTTAPPPAPRVSPPPSPPPAPRVSPPASPPPTPRPPSSGEAGKPQSRPPVKPPGK